jgi:thioredoxin-like negative regulator of GroEL
VKVNVDENQELAGRYDVRGIPAVKAFRNGAVVAEFVGAQPPAAVAAFLDGLTGPSPLERALSELRETDAFPEVLPALERGDLELALRVLLEEVDHAEGERRDRIRELMVLLFAELGQDHPLAVRYRRKLAAALY